MNTNIINEKCIIIIILLYLNMNQPDRFLNMRREEKVQIGQQKEKVSHVMSMLRDSSDIIL